MSWGDSWGDSPSEAAKRCAKAFYAGKTFERGNVYTCGSYYKLFGYAIAERIKPEDVPQIVAWKMEGRIVHRRLLAFRWPADDRIKTIARSFRALGLVDVDEGNNSMRYHRPPTIGGKKITVNEWFTHEDLAAAPIWIPPPKPRWQREPFVNLTMELFPQCRQNTG